LRLGLSLFSAAATAGNSTRLKPGMHDKLVVPIV
jgi:hypothetical protein